MDVIVRFMADWSVFLIVAISGYMLLFRVRGPRLRIYGNILMAGLLAYFFAKIASVLYQPSGGRPFEQLGIDAGASFLNNPGFPSDHALFVSALALAVWYGTRQRTVTLILWLLVAVVSVGRVLALVHTWQDVVFGVLCALVAALWYLNDPRPLQSSGAGKKRAS